MEEREADHAAPPSGPGHGGPGRGRRGGPARRPRLAPDRLRACQRGADGPGDRPARPDRRGLRGPHRRPRPGRKNAGAGRRPRRRRRGAIPLARPRRHARPRLRAAGADPLRDQRGHHGLQPERPPSGPRVAPADRRRRAPGAGDLLHRADLRPADDPGGGRRRGRPPGRRRIRRHQDLQPGRRRRVPGPDRGGEGEGPRPRRPRRAGAGFRGDARRRSIHRSRRGVRLHLFQRRSRSEERDRASARHGEDPEGRRDDAGGRHLA